LRWKTDGPAHIGRGDLSVDAVKPDLDLDDPALTFGEPVHVRDLTVWPIHGALREAEPPPRRDRSPHLTLDEALAKGLAHAVLEIDPGWPFPQLRETEIEAARRPAVRIHNRSDRFLLALGGEVLSRTCEDVILLADTLVAPGANTRVPCVELLTYLVPSSRQHWLRPEEAPRELERSLALIPPLGRYTAAVDPTHAALGNILFALGVGPPDEPLSQRSPYPPRRAWERMMAADDDALDLLEGLRSQGRARGLVAAVDPGGSRELVWADLFFDEDLFAAYEARLVRGYAIEARRHATLVAMAGRRCARPTLGIDLAVDDVILRLESQRQASARREGTRRRTGGLEHLHRVAFRRR
jgi:hypothetical protein